MLVTLNDLDRFSVKYDIAPRAKHVFNMFRMIYPDHVKVVFIGQSPYPGTCPISGTQYSFGPAFMTAPKCKTVPPTLRNVVLEVCRDMKKNPTISPNEMLLNWVDQGVMLLNSSLTLGQSCPKYLVDHSMLWNEIMIHIVSTISKQLNPVFVLIGKDAWKFFDVIDSPDVIQVSHPVAKNETATPWMGSGVFSKVSRMMVNREKAPIKWL